MGLYSEVDVACKQIVVHALFVDSSAPLYVFSYIYIIHYIVDITYVRIYACFIIHHHYVLHNQT